MMIDPMNPALQDRPDALNRIGGHRSTGVFSGAVVDRLMLVEQAVQIVEDHVVIGVELRADFDIGMDFAVDLVQRTDRRDLRPRPSAALPHAKHGHFADRAASSMEFLMLVFVGLFAAEERFVYLDYPFELVDGIGSAARLAEPSQNEPCGLLGHAYLFRQLHRADALAGRDQQVHGVNPLVERDLGALENGSRADREIEVPTGVAAVEPSLADGDTRFLPAVGTNRTVRPEPTFEIQPRRFVVGEQLEEFEGANGGLAHVSSVDDSRTGVKYIIPI